MKLQMGSRILSETVAGDDYPFFNEAPAPQAGQSPGDLNSSGKV